MGSFHRSPVVDLDAFAARAGEDVDLMAELAAMFETHGSRCYTACGRALARGDFAGGYVAASQLAEALRSVQAQEALSPARKLREAFAGEDLGAADAAYERLGAAIDRLRPVLRVLAAA